MGSDGGEGGGASGGRGYEADQKRNGTVMGAV